MVSEERRNHFAFVVDHPVFVILSAAKDLPAPTVRPLLLCYALPMSEPWIGLVEIIPDKDCVLLKPSEGAFVNVLTLASSREEFAAKVEDCMNDYKAVVLKITECASYAERVKTWTPSVHIEELASSLNKSTQVLLSTVHTYPLRPH